MYVNDEPLVFSETFVSVIRALLRIVWWSVGFTVVFCVQPAGCPRTTHPATPTDVWAWNNTYAHVLENYARGSMYYIMYPPPIRYRGMRDKWQSIFRFSFPYPRYYGRALHLQDRPRTATRDGWFMKVVQDPIRTRSRSGREKWIIYYIVYI